MNRALHVERRRRGRALRPAAFRLLPGARGKSPSVGSGGKGSIYIYHWARACSGRREGWNLRRSLQISHPSAIYRPTLHAGCRWRGGCPIARCVGGSPWMRSSGESARRGQMTTALVNRRLPPRIHSDPIPQSHNRPIVSKYVYTHVPKPHRRCGRAKGRRAAWPGYDGSGRGAAGGGGGCG